MFSRLLLFQLPVNEYNYASSTFSDRIFIRDDSMQLLHQMILKNLDSVYFNEITTIRGHYLQAKAHIIQNKHDTELWN